MKTPEAMGHVGIITLAGIISLLAAPWGVLVGIVLLISWVMYCKTS